MLSEYKWVFVAAVGLLAVVFLWVALERTITSIDGAVPDEITTLLVTPTPNPLTPQPTPPEPTPELGYRALADIPACGDGKLMRDGVPNCIGTPAPPEPTPTPGGPPTPTPNWGGLFHEPERVNTEHKELLMPGCLHDTLPNQVRYYYTAPETLPLESFTVAGAPFNQVAIWEMASPTHEFTVEDDDGNITVQSVYHTKRLWRCDFYGGHAVHVEE